MCGRQFRCQLCSPGRSPACSSASSSTRTGRTRSVPGANTQRTVKFLCIGIVRDPERSTCSFSRVNNKICNNNNSSVVARRPCARPSMPRNSCRDNDSHQGPAGRILRLGPAVVVVTPLGRWVDHEHTIIFISSPPVELGISGGREASHKSYTSYLRRGKDSRGVHRSPLRRRVLYVRHPLAAVNELFAVLALGCAVVALLDTRCSNPSLLRSL